MYLLLIMRCSFKCTVTYMYMYFQDILTFSKRNSSVTTCTCIMENILNLWYTLDTPPPNIYHVHVHVHSCKVIDTKARGLHLQKIRAIHVHVHVE